MEAMSFDDLTKLFAEGMKTNKSARVVVYTSVMQATVWTANPVQKGEAPARGAMKSKGYMNFCDKKEKAWLDHYILICNKKSYKEADQLL